MIGPKGNSADRSLEMLVNGVYYSVSLELNPKYSIYVNILFVQRNLNVDKALCSRMTIRDFLDLYSISFVSLAIEKSTKEESASGKEMH